MSFKEIDLIFPYVVFGYGLIMTLILNSQFFMDLAQKRLSKELYLQFTSHRYMGIVSLFVGGLWTLQNLWLS